jgi:hypothetical protein
MLLRKEDLSRGPALGTPLPQVTLQRAQLPWLERVGVASPMPKPLVAPPLERAAATRAPDAGAKSHPMVRMISPRLVRLSRTKAALDQTLDEGRMDATPAGCRAPVKLTPARP